MSNLSEAYRLGHEDGERGKKSRFPYNASANSLDAFSRKQKEYEDAYREGFEDGKSGR